MAQGRIVVSPQAYARWFGIIYLVGVVVALGGGVCLAIVFPGDTATVEDVLASPGLFRLSLAAHAVVALSEVALIVLLFALLAPVSPVLSGMAAAFHLLDTLATVRVLLDGQAALALLENAAPLSGSGEGARQALALFHIGLEIDGFEPDFVFYGAGALIVGWLVARSGFLPRAFGLLLAAAGIVAVVGSLLAPLAPAWSDVNWLAALVLLVAETAFALRLLLRGVDAERWAACRGESAAALPERG